MNELESKIIEKLRSQLKRGDMKRIAEKLGTSKNHVTEVFKGEAYSDNVIRAAIEIIDERNKLLEMAEKI